MILQKWEINGTEEIGLVTPTPGLWLIGANLDISLCNTIFLFGEFRAERSCECFSKCNFIWLYTSMAGDMLDKYIVWYCSGLSLYNKLTSCVVLTDKSHRVNDIIMHFFFAFLDNINIYSVFLFLLPLLISPPCNGTIMSKWNSIFTSKMLHLTYRYELHTSINSFRSNNEIFCGNLENIMNWLQ